MATDRNQIELNYRMNQRRVTVRAMDTVGVDDCYEVLWKSVIHRFATGEDLTAPVPRDVKDWLIKTNLSV